MTSLARCACALAIAMVAVAATGETAVGDPGARAGSLLAFGSNEYGQLGSLANNYSLNPNSTPAAIDLPGEIGTVTQMAVGRGDSLVVTSSGQLYAFGVNTWGQLASTVNNFFDTPNPTPTLVTLPGAIGPVTQVAAGGLHSLAVTASGQLYAFGYNAEGQLGTSLNSGGQTPTTTPALVMVPGGIDTVTQVAAGLDHSLILTSSGRVYAFGNNDDGQLGIPANSGVFAANPTPAPVTLPGQIGLATQIAAGASHSLVVTSSGQLYAFGTNDFGQLGNLTNFGTQTANPTPALVTLPGLIGQVTRIAAGAQHSLVVTSSGQLYAFGANALGELGIPGDSITASGIPTPTLISIPGLVGVPTQVAAGAAHSLVVTSSGQLFAFGRNERGQLGSDPGPPAIGTAHQQVPTLVSLPAGTTVDTVAQGSLADFTLALVADLAIGADVLAPARVGVPYRAALIGTGGTAPLRWSAEGLPAGLAIDSSSGAISGTALAAGAFSPVVTLVDAYGSSVARAIALNVADVIPRAPRLTAVRQAARRWLPGTRLPKLVTAAKLDKRGGLRVGTIFNFSLDQAARVTLTFGRAAIGRRVSGTCVATTPANTMRARCTRTLGEGALRVQAAPGVNKLRFEGRISRAARLRHGTHTVAIAATNVAGQSSPAKTLRFTVA